MGKALYTPGFTGTISEVRISNIARSDEWIAATHLSNTDALVTFGSEHLRGEQNIPVWLYVTLMFGQVSFLVYGFAHTGHRLYANIVALTIASILSFVNAELIVIGVVGSELPVIATASAYTSVVNNSTLVDTTFASQAHWFTIQDAGLMWLHALIGIVAGIVVLLMVADAVVEYRLNMGDD
jgi:hypothetical protein